MGDSLMISCPRHCAPLLADHEDLGRLFCPMGDCGTEVRVAATDGLPLSPLTQFEQGAAQHHELVLAHEGAGFSRSEAMQVLCTIISAGIMKGSGSG